MNQEKFHIYGIPDHVMTAAMQVREWMKAQNVPSDIKLCGLKLADNDQIEKNYYFWLGNETVKI